MHKAFTSAGRGLCSQNQCYALLPKGLLFPCVWDTRLGLWKEQYLLLPPALHWQTRWLTSGKSLHLWASWHFIFHNPAFLTLKKLVQRMLWPRYYTIIPQTKRKNTLWQLGYGYSTPIKLREVQPSGCVCFGILKTIKLFVFTTDLLDNGKMLFSQAVLVENSE